MQSPAISFYTPIVFLVNLVKNKKAKIINFERLSPKIFFNSGFFSILRKISYLLSLRLSDCLLTNSLEQLSYYFHFREITLHNFHLSNQQLDKFENQSLFNKSL